MRLRFLGCRIRYVGTLSIPSARPLARRLAARPRPPPRPLAPRLARGRGHPRAARGRGAVLEPRPPLLRRQGLDLPAPARGEGVPPGALPLPAPPRGHGAQLPRGDRVPGPPRRRAGGAARGAVRRGLDPPRPRRARPPRRVAQPPPVG